MIVTRYGVHWAPGGIPFLIQSSGTQNLISRQLESPFSLNLTPRRTPSPHEIDLSNAAPRPAWMDDPLAEVFAPTPRQPGERAKLIINDGSLDQQLRLLTRLCSPTGIMLRPLWWFNPQTQGQLYGLTNITPLVYLAGPGANTKDIFRHLEMAEAFERRLLITTPTRLPIFDGDWIETNLPDLSNEPLEAIGAGLLKEHMQCAGPQ